jgi:hypothetical protein
MAMSQKQQQETQRLKYVRVLERFVRSVIGYLVKEDESTFEGFVARVEKQYEFVKKVEPVALYKTELQEVEHLVQELLNVADHECEDFDKLRDDLLHKSNQLHKNKNQKKYKKDKHSKKKFKEWE